MASNQINLDEISLVVDTRNLLYNVLDNLISFRITKANYGLEKVMIEDKCLPSDSQVSKLFTKSIVLIIMK